MTVFFTKDKEWLDRWDDYVTTEPRASHLMLSDWLKSYESYGFDYELCIMLENNNLIGGFGAVIPKTMFFKFYIIPHGPIVNKGQEAFLGSLFERIKIRAKQLKCCLTQFSLPISSNPKIKNHVFNPSILQVDKKEFINEKMFHYVYCSYGLNWVDFKGVVNAEAYLEQLTPKVRRNIRLPYNKGTLVGFETQEELVRKGYEVIESNAKLGHYSVRSFNDFKQTLLSLTKKNAYFINLYYDEKIKASCLIIKAGNYLTNISGGVLREKPDIKLGYMLQWEAIKKSFDLGLSGYNISMGGSEGVKEFKARFGAEPIFFENPHYHAVIKPAVFNLFMFLEKYIKPYKSQISRFLAKFKK